MARTENCVLTNMCMIQDGDRILVEDRLNPSWPGITFPGGHVEPGESLVTSVIREVREETGLDIANVRLCGVKQWYNAAKQYRYLVFFFRTSTFSGTLKSSSEGDVFWIDRKELTQYRLADGFDTMLEVFERDDLSENYHWLEDGVWRVENR